MPPDLSQLAPDQLRHLAATLMSQVEEKDKALRRSEQVNQKLTYELALLKRDAFGKRSEQLVEVSRQHWGIENRLLWVLDVTMQEDQSRHRRDYGSENLALLRRLAFNVAKLVPPKGL